MSMKDSQTNAGTDPVVTEIVRFGFRFRYLWIGILLAVGVGAAVYSLTLANIYSSSAAIVIKAPAEETQVTGETEPLDVQALRSLVNSPFVTRSLYTRLTTGPNPLIDPQEKEYRSFRNQLQTRVQTEPGRTPGLLPMIELVAVSPVPEEARDIVNAWTDIVVKQSESIYSGEIEDLQTFFNRLFESAETRLVESERRLTSTTLQARLDVKKPQLQQMMATYGNMFGDLQTLEQNIQRRRAVRETLQALISKQEYNNEWVGDIALRHYHDAPSSEPEYLMDYSERIISAARNLVRLENELAEFELRSNLQYMEMMLTNKERQLSEVALRIVNTQNDLTQVESEYQAYAGEMSDQRNTIVLRKSITDDPMWEQALSSGEESLADLPSLRTEEIDPAYVEGRLAAMQLKSRMNGLRALSEKFDDQLDILRTEVGQLADSVTRLRAERKGIENAIEMRREFLDFLNLQYRVAMEQIEELDLQLETDQADLSAIQSRLGEIESASDQLQREILVSEDRIAAMERNIASQASIRESLAARAQELALVQVDPEALSRRSGVAVLYQGVENPIRVSPQRKKLVLTAVFVAAGAIALWILFYGLFRATVGSAIRTEDQEDRRHG